MEARLVIVAGPWQGVELALKPGLYVVGREHGCQLAVPDRALSRRHFQLEFTADRWQLRDLGSQNGTVVNGGVVALHELQAGDLIEAGRSQCRFETQAPSLLASLEAEAEDGSTAVGPLESHPGARPDRLAVLLALGDALGGAPNLEAFAERLARWLLDEVGARDVTVFQRRHHRLTASACFAASGPVPVRGVQLPLAAAGDACERGMAVALHTRESGRLVLVPVGAPAEMVAVAAGATRPPSASDLAFAACVGRLAAGHLVGQRRAELLASALSDAGDASELVTRSPAMAPVLEAIERAAPSDATILLLGETGSGKEVVARALHRHSRRAEAAFEAVNCAALPEGLIESELFGHERGAFTGALSRREGRFERAHGGTLFLDEIGEMSLPAQARLLRALQERVIQRVGGGKELPIDVRVVAATHRDLRADVSAGRFREDLYFRLSVVLVRLPALRDRQDDIEALAKHFLMRLRGKCGRRVDGFAPEVLPALRRYPWPGNVRELRNAIERALIMGRGGRIELGDLPAELAGGGAPQVSHIAVPAPLAEVERQAIEAALRSTRNNKSQAARLLGIDRMTLYSRLRSYGQSPDSDDD